MKSDASFPHLLPEPAWLDWWTGRYPRDAADLGTISVLPSDALRPVRLGVIRNLTIEPLDPFLRTAARLFRLDLDIRYAPVGALHESGDAGGGIWSGGLDAVLIALTPFELVDPCEVGAPDRLRQVIGSICGVIRGHWQGPVFLALLPHPDPSSTSGGPEVELTAACGDLPGTRRVGWDRALADVGRRRFFDQRLWEAVRYPFSNEGAIAAAREVISSVAASLASPVKCIVVDADDTLWGGLAGEEGFDGVVLSGARGASFRAFQARLRALVRSGFLLALCSKNNPSDVLPILQDHPGMVLKPADFVTRRINWIPKPENLRSIADELGFGLDALLFLDDSPFERAAVAAECPAVAVPSLPAEPGERAAWLDALPVLQAAGGTAEDRLRARDVSIDAERAATRASAATQEEYLASLDLRMRVDIDSVPHSARIAQLCARTNQFNCSVRRHPEAEILLRMEDRSWIVADFSLSDRFGDQGITGAAMVHIEGQTAAIESLLVSCRVFGRRAEHAFLGALLELLADRGVREVHIDYVPSDRNRVAAEFLGQVHGEIPNAAGRFRVTAPAEALRQPHVRLERARALEREAGA